MYVLVLVQMCITQGYVLALELCLFCTSSSLCTQIYEQKAILLWVLILLYQQKKHISVYILILYHSVVAKEI